MLVFQAEHNILMQSNGRLTRLRGRSFPVGRINQACLQEGTELHRQGLAAFKPAETYMHLFAA